MRAADIDASFVPRRTPRACTEVLDGECVILDDDGNHLHHLNPSATLVWSCFDGTGTVAEIARDLAAEFGSDPATTEADVLALTSDLGARGLLVDVEGDPGTGVEPGSPAVDELE